MIITGMYTGMMSIVTGKRSVDTGIDLIMMYYEGIFIGIYRYIITL